MSTRLYGAVMVAVVVEVTADVVMGKVALEPCDMVMLVGTEAAVLFDERVTTAPPAGAAAVRATVPPDGLPPITLAGLTLTEDRLARFGGPLTGVSLAMKAS